MNPIALFRAESRGIANAYSLPRPREIGRASCRERVCQYVTLAGFLLAKAGHLMKESEEVVFEDSIFRVEQMIGRRIMRVRLTRSAPVKESKPA